jgi:predicted metal-dependent enzyme (double-stranded beta helix superfamily)
MTTASTAHRLAVSAARPALIDLIAAVRHVVAMRAGWARTAILVADQLRAHLPGPGILTPGQRRGQPGRLAGHVRHAETGSTFSILGLVWRPGQSTRIHDHITWCVMGHRIRNTGTRTAISLHIYGTDITRIGSSARRYYS